MGFAAVQAHVLYRFAINAVFAVGFGDKASMFLGFSMEGAPGQQEGGGEVGARVRHPPRGLFSDRDAFSGGAHPFVQMYRLRFPSLLFVNKRRIDCSRGS